METKVKDKINRIVSRNPELRQTILSLENPKVRQHLTKIVSNLPDKILLVGKNSDYYAHLYLLAHIITYGYIHSTTVSTVDLLDAYTYDSHDTDQDEVPRYTSLSQVVDDIVLIYDSRAFVPNKQKSNMIMQVFEQNTRCIYYYKGTHKSFIEEHRSLVEYLKEQGIPKLNIEGTRGVALMSPVPTHSDDTDEV